jgi:hypothetical protein
VAQDRQFDIAHRDLATPQVGYPQVMARRREIVRASPHGQRDHWFVVGTVSRGAMRLKETHAKKDCDGEVAACLGTDAAAFS